MPQPRETTLNGTSVEPGGASAPLTGELGWPESGDPAIDDASGRLREALDEYAPTADHSKIQRALRFAIESHIGDLRKSGEPYVIHPIEVAIILTRMRLDPDMIAASLLHDVVEDSGVTLEDLAGRFGDRVAKLVDGVTKLGQIPWTGEVDQATRERTAQ